MPFRELVIETAPRVGSVVAGTAAPLLSCLLTVEQSENHRLVTCLCSSRWRFLGLHVLEGKSAQSAREQFYSGMGLLLRCREVAECIRL